MWREATETAQETRELSREMIEPTALPESGVIGQKFNKITTWKIPTHEVTPFPTGELVSNRFRARAGTLSSASSPFCTFTAPRLSHGRMIHLFPERHHIRVRRWFHRTFRSTKCPKRFQRQLTPDPAEDTQHDVVLESAHPARRALYALPPPAPSRGRHPLAGAEKGLTTCL